MNREQIEKALEHCISGEGCYLCPLNLALPPEEDCNINKHSLLLIKELTEKEKKSDRVFSDLYKEAETYLAQRECLRNQVKNLTKENERLRAQVDMWTSTAYCEKDRLNSIKADTVRKMQERITEHATNGYPRKVRLDVIDQIAKEMLEGKHGG